MAALHSVTSFAEIQQALADCTLVSMDIEGLVDEALEVGLAICNRVDNIDPEHSYSAFIKQNMINCFTIRLRNPSHGRIKGQERLRFGVEAENIDQTPETTISSYINKFPSRCRILVLYDRQIELKWLAKTCPNLLRTFSAVVDVQCLIADASNQRRPSLRQCLTALSLDEDLPTVKMNRQHRACNDAVYSLALMAAMLSRDTNAPPLEIATNPKRPRLFHGRPYPARAHPFTALIRTTDRTPLPPEIDTAGKIYNYFSSFSPRTAGTGLTRRVSSNQEQLSWSWISFSTKEDLDRFQTSVSYTLPSRKQIRIESQFIPGVTLTGEERRAKQIEDGDRIREERRKARAKAEGSIPDVIQTAGQQRPIQLQASDRKTGMVSDKGRDRGNLCIYTPASEQPFELCNGPKAV